VIAHLRGFYFFGLIISTIIWPLQGQSIFI